MFFFSPTIFLIFKIIIVFIFLILIRITVPRMKLETISKTGWFFGFCILCLTFFSYIFFWFLA